MRGSPACCREQDVAVKQIYNRNEEEYDVNLYFAREVDILRYIKHPHCVRFLGFATSGDLYLVTELIKGGDLRKYLKANHMPWPDRVRVAIQIASALAYLHRNRFIHRDVKTENVLLDENGDAKLCDFGFSRCARRAPPRARAAHPARSAAPTKTTRRPKA